MLGAIYRFETRYHLTRPLLYLVGALLGLLAFGAVSSDTVRIGGAIGNVDRNAPLVIIQLLAFLTPISTFIVTAFVASASVRDFELGTYPLFFSKPMKKMDYLLGRFGGSLTASFLTFVLPALGIAIGTLMPWIDPERLGPFRLDAYLFGLFVMVLPSVIFLAAVFFTLGAWTRSFLTTYLGVVGFFVGFFIAQRMIGDVESVALGAMIDPFGLAALGEQTRYWTIVERNGALPEIGGLLLWNRLLWVGIGLAIFAIGAWRFQPTQTGTGRRLFGRKTKKDAGAEAQAKAPTERTLPRIEPSFAGGAWSQYVHATRFEVASIFRGILFLVLLAFGLLNIVASSGFVDRIYGTKVYPETHLMLNLIEGAYSFLLIIITIFYAGELVWRERGQRTDDVVDAAPTANGVFLLSKLSALMLALVAFIATGGIATVLIQLAKGYTKIEPLLYLQGLGIITYPFLLIGVLSLAVQVLTNHKFVGYMLMIGYMISSIILSLLDFTHNLYQYADSPGRPYSAMNGYGHFLESQLWFNGYWTFAAVILIALSALFWVRGKETERRFRVALAKARLHGPWRAVLAAGIVGFLATGAWIFYNTNVLNQFVPPDEGRANQAAYETKYRQYIDEPMPRIVDVDLEVDIFPAERAMNAHGTWKLVNETDVPIDTLYFSLTPGVELEMDLPPHEVTVDDEVLGFRIVALETPLEPGAPMELTFDVRVRNEGFVNAGSDTSLVYNGTFFNNFQYFPALGYQAGRQLQDSTRRREHDLGPLQRVPKVDDLEARRNTYLTADSDWVHFAATVSTSPDQIAIAPGYLQREWQEDGRRYFRYEMDAPILRFYSFLSARYEVRRATWTGPVATVGRRTTVPPSPESENVLASLDEPPAETDTTASDPFGAEETEVALEIYYQPGHETNVDRMVDAIQKSLDYFTENFSPYQHRQVRILEFPRYAQFAQSFPNTIPFSESIGFIARLDEDPEAIDYVFYVTAHEVAHQWWAHQVIGGNVQGATMLSETMSQYSALMVMEKEYGRDAMGRFLKYELDSYLRSRGGELVEEMPLMLVENQQYIHYRKGSVIMYALRDLLGEEPLNRAIRRYVETVAFQEPPFTYTPEFLSFVRAEADEEQQATIDDFFAKITLFENRAAEATYVEQDDGTYLVRLEAEAKKVYADGQGIETETTLDDWIEVGVFAEEEVDGKTEPKVLYLEKRRVTDANPVFEIVVDEKPLRAGIDPLHKLVDRNTDDNVRKVTEADAGEVAEQAAQVSR